MKINVSAVFVLVFLFNSAVLAQEKSSVYDLSQIITFEDTSEEMIEQVKALAGNMSDPVATKERATAILQQVKQGAQINQYDFLWVPYALLRVAYSGSGSGLSEEDELIIALNTVAYLDENGVGEWQYTEQGQFKREVYRTAGNAAAWSLRESNPKRALQLVEQTLQHARPEDTFLQDTHVRILLNLDEKEKAFNVVRQVLEEDPEFVDFQDFLSNEEYLSWLKKN